MLTHDLQRENGVLVITPDGPLEAADFTTLASHVDAYLAHNGKLRGVLVRAISFAGWKDFGALLAHLKFVKDHHRKIERVAVVADGGVATIMPHIASHFMHADIKHFNYADERAAWDWLMQLGSPLTRTAA